MLFVFQLSAFYLLQKLVCLYPYEALTNSCSGQPGNLLIWPGKALHLAYWILCSEVCRTRRNEYSNCHQLSNEYNHNFRKQTSKITVRKQISMFSDLLACIKNLWLEMSLSFTIHAWHTLTLVSSILKSVFLLNYFKRNCRSLKLM